MSYLDFGSNFELARGQVRKVSRVNGTVGTELQASTPLFTRSLKN